MKRILSLFLLLALLAFPACADSSWKSAVTPGEEIKDAHTLLLIDSADSPILVVGRDIPAGLYRICPGYINGWPLLSTYYGLFISRNGEQLADMTIYNTDANSDLLFCLQDGDFFSVLLTGDNVVYLASADDALLLRPYGQ